jgi:hypothetical protein
MTVNYMGFLVAQGVMQKQSFDMRHMFSSIEKLKDQLISESYEIQIFVRLHWRWRANLFLSLHFVMDSEICRTLLGRLRWENANITLLKLWHVLQVLPFMIQCGLPALSKWF